MPIPTGNWYELGIKLRTHFLDEKVLKARRYKKRMKGKKTKYNPQKIEKVLKARLRLIGRGSTLRNTTNCANCNTKMEKDDLQDVFCPNKQCNNFGSIFNWPIIDQY